MLGTALAASPARAQDGLPAGEVVAGQELLYSGRFGAAQLYFAQLAQSYPREAAGRALEAAALIWWGEARDEEDFQADSIDRLLDAAVRRARLAADSATGDSMRRAALFWLGTAYGYRARQAELRGNVWKAARDAKTMRNALERALALDSTCTDCQLGLGIYEYALARAGALARLAAKLLGLGSGDATRALERLRLVSERGVLARTEARWVYANALLREGRADPALREEALRLLGALAEEFPENPVFRRAAAPVAVGP